MGCPIRKFTDQSLFAAPHDLSQRITSFIACACQGIHQMPFFHLIILIVNAHHTLPLTRKALRKGRTIRSGGRSALPRHQRCFGAAFYPSVSQPPLLRIERGKHVRSSLISSLSNTANTEGCAIHSASCSGVLVDRAAKPNRRKTSFSRRTPMACGQATPINDKRLVRIPAKAMNLSLRTPRRQIFVPSLKEAP